MSDLVIEIIFYVLLTIVGGLGLIRDEKNMNSYGCDGYDDGANEYFILYGLTAYFGMDSLRTQQVVDLHPKTLFSSENA